MNDYKNTASLYDALLPIRFEEIRFYRKYCKKGYSVLEVGCGTGNILLNLMKETRARDYTGIDISTSMLSIFQQNYNEQKLIHPVLEHIELNIENIDLLEYNTNKKYDLIIFPGQVIQTVKKSDIKTVIEKYYNLLEINGRLIFDSFNPIELGYKVNIEHLHGQNIANKEIIISTLIPFHIDENRIEYELTVKKYDSKRNKILESTDLFCISVIDDSYIGKLINENQWYVEEWLPQFPGLQITSDKEYSVIVLKRTI